MANCLYAAMVEEILANCSCKPFFLNWAARSSRVKDSTSLPFCTGPNLSCMKSKLNQWGDEAKKMDRVMNLATGKVDVCYNSCQHQEEELQLTSATMPSSNILPSSYIYCTIVRKIRDIICVVTYIILKTTKQFFPPGQDNDKRAVFERFYRNKFGCQIFQRQSSCPGTNQAEDDEGGDRDNAQVYL